MLKPKFNPEKSFETVKGEKPKFNPDGSFDTVKKKDGTSVSDGEKPTTTTSDSEGQAKTKPSVGSGTSFSDASGIVDWDSYRGADFTPDPYLLRNKRAPKTERTEGEKAAEGVVKQITGSPLSESIMKGTTSVAKGIEGSVIASGQKRVDQSADITGEKEWKAPISKKDYEAKYKDKLTVADKTLGIVKGYPGKEDSEYIKVDGQWKESKEKIKIKNVTGAPEDILEGSKVLNIADEKFAKTQVWSDVVDPKKIAELDSHFLKADVYSKDYLDIQAKHIKGREVQSIVNSLDSKLSTAFASLDEDVAVPKLRKTLKNLGPEYDMFNIEEAGFWGDGLTITNRLTGESKDISLDNWSQERNRIESDVLKGFIKYGLETADYGASVQKVKNIKQEIELANKEHRYQDALNLELELQTANKELVNADTERRNKVRGKADMEAAMYKSVDVKNTREEINADIVKGLQMKVDAREKTEQIKQVVKAYDDGRISEADWNEKWVPQVQGLVNDIDKANYEFVDNAERLAQKQEDITAAAAANYAQGEDRGSALAAVGHSAASLLTNIIGGFMAMKGESWDQEALTRQLSPGIYESAYMESEKRSTTFKLTKGLADFIGQTIIGTLLFKSPAMGITRLATTATKIAPGYWSGFIMSSSGAGKEMSSSSWDGVAKHEKQLLGLLMGIVGGTTSGLGVGAAMSKTPLGQVSQQWINKMLFKTIKEAPRGASISVIENLLKANVKTNIAYRVVGVGSASIAEGGEEVIQGLAETSIKEIYNIMKDKELFSTPDGVSEYVDMMAESFKFGIIGGAVLNAGSQVKSIYRDGFKDTDQGVAQFDILSELSTNDKMFSMFEADIKKQVDLGIISEKEGNLRVDLVRRVGGLINKIPSDISPEKKAEAFNLIKEKQDLEQQVKGKDPNLVKSETARIEEINLEMQKIRAEGESEIESAWLEKAKQVASDVETKTKEDAIQKQETEEVAKSYVEELSKTKQESPEDYWSVSEVTLNDAIEGEVIETEGGKALVDKTGTIRGVLEKAGTTLKNVAKDILEKAVAAGGTKLDNYDNYLTKIYQKAGFKIVSRIPFNEEYAPEGWNKEKHGTPDVVAMVYDPNNELNIEEKTFEDYDEAMAYRDSFAQEAITEDVDSFESVVTKGVTATKEWLDKLDEKITDYGKKNLGMNVPAVLLQGAIKIAKVTATTTKVVSEIVDSAINHIKDSDWYKKELSKKEKSQFENDFKSMFYEGDITKVTVASDERAITIAKIQENIKTSKKSGADKVIAATKDLQNSKWYTEATDVQRESAVRELRKNLGAKEKKSPSTTKLGITPKGDKITVNEKSALKTQIQLRAKAAREGSMSERKARLKVADIIEAEMKAVKGKYTDRQVRSVVKRALEMNLSDPVTASRFADYVSKVVADAEYSNKLNDAKKVKKSISKKSKQKNQDYKLAAMGSSFAKIDPRNVDNIDEYLEMAKMVDASVTKSKVRKGEPIYRDTADIATVAEYTEKIIKKQADLKKEDMEMEYPELFDSGVLNKDMSIEDINEVLSSVDPKKSEKIDEDKLKGQVKRAMNSHVKIIEEMISTKKDPFTGEDVDLDDRQIEAIRTITKVDVDRLDVKELLGLVDMMSNFIVNGSTGKMVATGKYYSGLENAKIAKNDVKIKANDTWKLTRAYVNAFGSMSLLLDNILGSTTKAIAFKRLSGLADFISGAVKGENESDRTNKAYSAKFKKKKANGEKFNTARNTYERGMYATLIRNNPGDSAAMNQEFKRRVKLVNESIEYLNSARSTSDEKEIGKIYSNIADKFNLNDPNVTMEDIDTSIDTVNKEAVSWWIEKWGEKYGDLSAVSEDVYNNALSNDLNYTPDSFRKRDNQAETIDDAMKDAAIGYNDHVHNKKSASLMKANNPKILPKDRYLNLDFDINNSNNFKSAMIDLNTAGSVEQIKGFLSSDEFGDMFNGDNKKLIEGRIKRYILNKKVGDTQVNMSEGDKMVRKATNLIAKAGVARVLAGIEQIPKQTISIIGNTLANTRRFTLGVSFRRDVNEWIINSGYPISRRGIESSAAIERAEKNMDKYSGTINDLGKKVSAISDVFMKEFLVSPDKRVAVASFVSFYKSNLKRRGLSTKIDYSKPMDQDAADYAQHMVDRQQNVSDPDTAGEFWTNSNKDVVRKLLFPLANFTMNMKVRTYTDLKILTSNMSNSKDKAAATYSLGGTVVELAAFHMVSMLIREAYKDMADELTGYVGDEDDPYVNGKVKSEKARLKRENLPEMTDAKEDEFRARVSAKRRKSSAWKTTATSAIKDFFSPMPILDDVAVKSFNWVSEKIAINSDTNSKEANEAVAVEVARRKKSGKEELTDNEKAKIREDVASYNAFKIWDFEKESYADMFGTAGILMDKWNESETTSLMANEGVIRTEIFGKEVDKYLLPKHQEMAKTNNYVNWAYLLGLVPSDVGKISRYASKNLEKMGFTKTKMDEYERLFKKRTDSKSTGEKLRKEIEAKPNVISVDEERQIRNTGKITKSDWDYSTGKGVSKL